MNRLRTLALTVGLLSNVIGYAYDFEVDGIYYKITSKGAEYTVEVTYKEFNSSTNYAGDIEIPSTVSRSSVAYSSVTYNVTGIGSYAFHGCSNLTSITLPEGVTSIGYGAFDNCCNLTSVTIPKSVISVGEWAFCCCESLDSLIIPQSLTSIGENAFYGCGNLTSIAVAKGNAIYDSRNNCNAIIETNSNTLIVGCSSTVIPEDVTDIKKFAFTDCASLASITIPQSVNSIGENAFLRCSNLVSISVEKGNAIYDSRNNCNAIIQTNNNTLIVGCSSTVIPEDVNSIGDYAFNWCSKLTSIVIPESVRCIGNYAFNGCTSLKELTFKDGSEDLLLGYNYYSSNQVGEGLFYDCPLEKVYLGRNLSFYSDESCGYSPFYNKVGLTSVIIGSNVTILGSNTFYGCTGELTVNCNIPSKAFYGSMFSKVVIGDGVTNIGSYAFGKCVSLTSIIIPESVVSIGDGAFENCSSLTFIAIPENVISIGGYTFADCCSLTSIIIPENVMSVGNYAFSNCI